MLRPLDRDSVDLRIIQEIQTGTGGIIDSQNEVGGYPTATVTYRQLNIPKDCNIKEWIEEYARQVEEP